MPPVLACAARCDSLTARGEVHAVRSCDRRGDALSGTTVLDRRAAGPARRLGTGHVRAKAGLDLWAKPRSLLHELDFLRRCRFSREFGVALFADLSGPDPRLHLWLRTCPADTCPSHGAAFDLDRRFSFSSVREKRDRRRTGNDLRHHRIAALYGAATAIRGSIAAGARSRSKGERNRRRTGAAGHRQHGSLRHPVWFASCRPGGGECRAGALHCS